MRLSTIQIVCVCVCFAVAYLRARTADDDGEDAEVGDCGTNWNLITVSTFGESRLRGAGVADWGRLKQL